jgi:2-hydroxy-3-keto-5-methylthiopentenyl-1-phosphate phosphatase
MYTFLVDFDGTITLHDTTDGLFERFADPSWHELDAAWARGELSTAQQVERCYAMVDASRRSTTTLALWQSTKAFCPLWRVVAKRAGRFKWLAMGSTTTSPEFCVAMA